ncbi:clathrin light chain [Punctularia strigosozonata HHB-11173 SS5]|uniref:clathrin light chain n=1 Tax=Punctularia strigosozonata (strain HHB-11173) TaxID=741275 RepID=UPI0004416996|nr:clathrin light chain [Punctularia strigosozonata HHB-11173 SS5]EIN06780.1 clathrin light chain [Punctularia strigosozonata HHB-11173 SS5]
MSNDFLARENELLGGEFDSAGLTGGNSADDIDFDRAASAFPDISLDGSGDIPSVVSPAVAAQPTGGFSFDDFGSPPRERVTEVKVTGDDEIEKFEDQFPDIEPPVPVSSVPTFGATPTFAPRPQPSALASTPILTQQIQEDEPEVIKQWREHQAEQIKVRDEASKQKRQETIAKAERSIDQFYEEYNAKKERNIRENKVQEQEYLASLTDSLSVGTTWQRICSLVELENSQSKTLARAGPGASDLSRFKEVLLRLKREGDAAPGAAGY